MNLSGMSTARSLQVLALLIAGGSAMPAWAQVLDGPEVKAAQELVGKPASELIAAGWVGSPVTLRGVKGNTVVLSFWNGDSGYFDSPEYFLKSILSDYQKYSRTRNMTFISVCCSMTATLQAMERQVSQFRLTPFPTMLDSAGATAHAYKVPKGYGTWIIVIDGDGKIAYSDSKGWFWSGGPDKGKLVHHTMIENSAKNAPGILGIPKVPPVAELSAHYYDLQQFLLAEAEIKRLEKLPAEDVKSFAATLREKIADVRKKRLSEIEEMSKTTPVHAYREAIAFVAAFPTSPERAPMNDIGKGLQKEAAVKSELQAEDAYRRIVVPELMKAPKGTADFDLRVAPLLKGYLKTYGTTEYAAAVTDGVEGYKMAAGRSR
jgi:hypothetical protein